LKKEKKKNRGLEFEKHVGKEISNKKKMKKRRNKNERKNFYKRTGHSGVKHLPS